MLGGSFELLIFLQPLASCSPCPNPYIFKESVRNVYVMHLEKKKKKPLIIVLLELVVVVLAFAGARTRLIWKPYCFYCCFVLVYSFDMCVKVFACVA